MLYVPTGESPYYTSFYKMQLRLLDVARRAGDLRVYKDGALTFGVRAGQFMDGAAARDFAGAAGQSLADDATNYIFLTAAGVLTVNQAGFPSPLDAAHIPLATITVSGGDYAHGDIVDYRGRAIFGVPSAMTAGDAGTLVAGAASDADALHTHASLKPLVGTAAALAAQVPAAGQVVCETDTKLHKIGDGATTCAQLVPFDPAAPTYQAYDPAAARTYCTGPALDMQSTGYLDYGPTNSAGGAKWFHSLRPIYPAGGVAVPVTAVQWRSRGMTACAAVKAAIVKALGGGQYVPVAVADVDITGETGDNLERTSALKAVAMTFAPDGVSQYYEAVSFQGTAGAAANNPRLYQIPAGAGPQDAINIGNLDNPFVVGTQVDLSAASAGQPGVMFRFTYATSNHTPFRIPAAAYVGNAQKRFWIPQYADTDHVIKLGGVTPDAGADSTISVALCELNPQTAARYQNNILTLTSSAAPKMTFATFDVNLTEGQANVRGKPFDILIGQWVVSVPNKPIDAIWCNRGYGAGPQSTHDFVTISHAAAHFGAYGNNYLEAWGGWSSPVQPQWIEVTGSTANCTIASIEVGWDPQVIIGDSQIGTSGNPNILTRLGSAIAAALPDRITWCGGIGGNWITRTNAAESLSLLTRYQHPSTIGIALSQFRGATYHIAEGINDINGAVVAADIAGTVPLMVGYLGQIVANIRTNGNRVVLYTLPPCSLAGTATATRSAAIAAFNGSLVGLALASRCPLVNAWFPMRDGDLSAGIPAFKAAYTSDAGLHYNDAGAAIVAASAVAENARGATPANINIGVRT